MQTYLWGILVAAFIIDIIRLKSSTSSINPPQETQQEAAVIPEVDPIIEPMKIKEGNEELKVSYSSSNDDESIPTIPKKKKNKNQKSKNISSEIVHLHIQLCLS